MSVLVGVVLFVVALTGCTPPASEAMVESPTVAMQTEIPMPHAVLSDTNQFQLVPTVSLTPIVSPISVATTVPVADATSNPTTMPTTMPTNSPALLQPSLMPLSERQQLFDEVWHMVNEHYLYPDFHGLDWAAVREEFAPKVARARSNDDFYVLLTEMVGRLGDQHSRFLAPGDAVAEDAQSTGVETRVGIGVIMMVSAEGTVIQQVFAGSPAERAGLRPRDRIVAVNGTRCVVDGCDSLDGPEGSHVRLTVEAPGEEARDVVVTREYIDIRVVPVVRRLEGNIGYMSIPSLWISDMDEQVSGALTDLVVEKPLNGLILDLRGNPGGWRNVLMSVMSHFVQGEVGAFFDRHHDATLFVKQGSGPDLRDLPLVVFIDQETSSYAEVLAAVLQAEAGAYVVGVPSPGNTETIYAYELNGGARLWLAQEGFRLRNGKNLEGEGVQPDVVIDVDWSSYSEENDPYILEALRLLERYVQ